MATVSGSTRASGSASISPSSCASSSVNDPTRRRRSVSEVREAAERGAEIGGERADVGAAPALDDDGRLRVRTGRELLDLEPVDAHRPRRPLDLLPGPGQLVEATPADLHRRDHRRELLDVADEARERALDLVAGERHGALVEDLARGVERAGGDAEHDPAPVGLALLREVAQQAGGAAEPDEQHAGGVGIEGAGVTRPGAGRRPCASDRRRRATCSPPACRRRRGRPAGCRAPAGDQSAPRMRATTVGMSRVDSKPAAKR